MIEHVGDVPSLQGFQWLEGSRGGGIECMPQGLAVDRRQIEEHHQVVRPGRSDGFSRGYGILDGNDVVASVSKQCRERFTSRSIRIRDDDVHGGHVFKLAGLPLLCPHQHLMAQPPNLASLQVGARLQDPLLVRRVETRDSGAGGFTILTLGNATGVITSAPFWLADQPRIAGITHGDVVQVIGEVTTYRDRRQLDISSIRVLPHGSIEWGTLMPSVGDPAPYWETIDRWLLEIEPRRLRTAVETFFLDLELRDRYTHCPAALSGSQAILGGLLKHTVEVTAIARTLARVMSADPGLTLAGALLHDIGKTEAYTWAGVFELSDSGAQLGPDALGSIMLERRLRAPSAPVLTEAEVRELQHIVLAAGPGSVVPRTLAAKAIQLADAASVEAAQAVTNLDAVDVASLFGNLPVDS